MEWKAFFFIFKDFLVAKNCLRPKSAPLNNSMTSVSPKAHILQKC